MKIALTSVFVDDQRVRPSLYQAFGPHLPDAVALTLGRSIPVSLDNTPDAALARPIAGGGGTRRFRLENGTLVPLDVQAGDRILFGKYSGNDIKLDGEEYMIMREDEILGILDRQPAAAKKAS